MQVKNEEKLRAILKMAVGSDAVSYEVAQSDGKKSHNKRNVMTNSTQYSYSHRKK